MAPTEVEYNQHETTYNGEEIVVHWYNRNGQIKIGATLDMLGNNVSVGYKDQKRIKNEIIDNE